MVVNAREKPSRNGEGITRGAMDDSIFRHDGVSTKDQSNLRQGVRRLS